MRHLFVLLALVTLFSGCGGVNSRIKENERLFASYPPEAQAQIQNGRIDRGFTEEMVYIALGKPDAKTTALQDGKTITLWRYLRRETKASPQASSGLSGPYGHPTFGPGPLHPTPMIYEKRYLNVEFIDGKVARWDSRLQDDTHDKQY